MIKRPVAVFVGILGVLLFSTKAVLVKLAYQYEVDAVSLLLLRMSFALPFYLVMIATKARPLPSTTKREYLFVFLFGFLGYYLASYLDFQGLKYIKASVERLVLFAYPSLVLIIGYFALGQKVLKSQVLAILVTYLGIVLVFIPEATVSEGGKTLLGGVLVLLSAVAYASYIVGSGWLIPKFGALRFTSYCMTVSCLLVLIHYALVQRQDLSQVLDLPLPVYGYALLMAFIATVLPSYFISYAIKGIGSNQLAIFGSLGPISTILLAYIFLDERLGWMQLLGGTIVIMGIWIAEKKRLSGS
ncbi:MAG: DMT family transporter [Bacteroidota bacterium]